MKISKIQSGALTYAIFIMIISVLITGTVISIAYYNRMYTDIEIAKNNLISYSESIIDAAVSDSTISFPWDCKECKLTSDEEYVFLAEREVWGGYYIYSINTSYRNYSYKKMYLCGNKGVLNNNTALYFVDNHNALHIAGDTRITGDCYLPKAGIKRAYIEGRNYSGKKTVYGNTYTSERSLPPVNSNYKQSVQNALQGKASPNDSIIPFSSLTNRTFDNSFNNKTLCLIADEHIYLNECRFTGNIKLYSNKGITIFPSAELKDIMLFAPNIYFKQESKVSLQAYASDTISVEKGVSLNFPSVLGIVSTTNNSLIDIQEDAVIHGNIWIVKTIKSAKNKNTFRLGKKSLLNGTAHIEGYTSLKGKVYGSVYTENFILKTFAGTYKNHLFDATINAEAINAFHASAILNEKRSSRVIKVLD